jgi:hypothetical protein
MRSRVVGCIFDGMVYIGGVMSEAVTSPIVLLSSEYDPDGYRPARPGFLHHQRDAKRPWPHNIPSVIEN